MHFWNQVFEQNGPLRVCLKFWTAYEGLNGQNDLSYRSYDEATDLKKYRFNKCQVGDISAL
jgi:hypothetical protein